MMRSTLSSPLVLSESHHRDSYPGPEEKKTLAFPTEIQRRIFDNWSACCGGVARVRAKALQHIYPSGLHTVGTDLRHLRQLHTRSSNTSPRQWQGQKCPQYTSASWPWALATNCARPLCVLHRTPVCPAVDESMTSIKGRNRWAAHPRDDLRQAILTRVCQDDGGQRVNSS